MNVHEIPDFFQQESGAALRSQAKWLDKNLGLDTRFLAEVLHENETRIEEWKNQRAPLPSPSEDVFRDFWYVILHLLAHYNNDEKRVRQLFEHAAPATAKPVFSPVLPPWFGSSLKTYLEAHGADAIKEVNDWVMSFRFGDPYSTSSKMITCP